MQIHKGHDQDIFGLMGKDTKIFQKNLNFSIGMSYFEWNRFRFFFKSYVFIIDNVSAALQHWMLHLQPKGR